MSTLYKKMLKKELIDELKWRDNELNRLRQKLLWKEKEIDLLKVSRGYIVVEELAKGLDATAHVVSDLRSIIQRGSIK